MIQNNPSSTNHDNTNSGSANNTANTNTETKPDIAPESTHTTPNKTEDNKTDAVKSANYANYNPKMIPVSLLSAYSYCPRKIFLERVLKIAEIPKEAVLRGTIRHAGFERLNKGEQEIVFGIKKQDNLQDIRERYKNLVSSGVRRSIIDNMNTLKRLRLEPSAMFSSVMKRFLPEIDMRAGSVFDFMQKENVYGEELWMSLTPKYKSEYKASSSALRLAGVIDIVLVSKYSLMPVELKTGSAPKEGVWPGHRLQLAAYIMLLEDMFDMIISKGSIRYLAEDTQREVFINPFMRKEVIDTRINVEKLLLSKEAPKKVQNEKKCAACGLKKECFNDELILKLALEKGI